MFGRLWASFRDLLYLHFRKGNKMTNTVGSVQDFKTKPYAVKALQFTGENGRAFIEFVAELNTTNPLDGVKVRNGIPKTGASS